MATFQETLAEFDRENNRFNGWQYLLQLHQCTDVKPNDIAYQGEEVAASLEDKLRTDDNFPADAITNKDITAEIISYWESRIDETQNILLKALYAGLVWYLKKPITHDSCPIAIAQTYIETLIRIVTQDHMPFPIFGVQQAERAIQLSLKLKQPDLLKKAKEALRGLIDRYGKKDRIRIWSSAYRISQKYSNSYTPEEQARLITDLECRFTAIYNKTEDEKRDPTLLMDLADIIAGYYRKHSPDKIDNLFEKIEETFDAVSPDVNKTELYANYIRLYNSLIKYGLNHRTAQLRLKIATISLEFQSEMPLIKSECEIPKKDVHDIVNSILQHEDSEQIFEHFIYVFIPQQEREKQSLQEEAKKYAFLFIIPKTIMHEKGGQVTVGNVETDFDGNLILHISMIMKFQSIFINSTIDEGIHRGVFTTENILAYISQSPSFTKEKIPIIKRGLEAYFAQDYIVAIHLLIPQIEASIRSLLERENIPTLKSCKSPNEFQQRTLDDMLRDSKAIELLTPNLAAYFRILLTDNRGWNLRNEVCHGLTEISQFDPMTANRIIHALLCLGCFRGQTN